MKAVRTGSFVLSSALSAAVAVALASASATGCSTAADPTPAVPSDTTPETGGASDGGPRTDASNHDADAAVTDARADSGDSGATRCLGESTGDGGDGSDGGDGGIACAASPTCSLPCSNIVDHYKAGVAAEAAACILALPTCAGEGSTDVIPCVDTALAQACPDPTTAAFCAPLLAGCGGDPGDAGGPLTQLGCESFASGLSAAGRAAFAACVTGGVEGSCTTDLVGCIDAIRR